MTHAKLPATLVASRLVLVLVTVAATSGAAGEGVVNSVPRTTHATTAAGSRAVLVVTSSGDAAPAILEALVEGRINAMDAALAMAFVQIVHSGGAWVSFAGILSAMHYDPDGARVEWLDAGFDMPREEGAPRTIPSRGTPSGRATLTPGFMAGAAAAHARYGQAAWSALFSPAIADAASGIPVSPALAKLIEFRTPVLARTEEGRELFMPQGRALEAGEILRQPALARLLERVARDGAETMVTGSWAAAFVARVRAAGGMITTTDLAAYEPHRQSPLAIEYAGATVYGPALPQLAGLCLSEALARIGKGTMRRLGHYSQSADAISRLVRASHYCYLRYLDPAPERVLKQLEREADRSVAPIPLADRLAGPIPGGPHSDVVVAVDPAGRIAVVCHSINTTAWGTTGLFVEGVSVPDSASFQQSLLAHTGPGARVPNALAPVLIVRDGRPLVAMGGVGASVSELMLQSTVNLLDFELSAESTANAPMVLQTIWPSIGRFQILLFFVGAIVFVPAIGVGMINVVAGRESAACALVVLACVANLGFAAAVHAAGGYGCRSCLATIDRPWILTLVGIAAVLGAARLLTVGTVSLGARLGMAVAALSALAYIPLMRGSLEPINVVEAGRFSADLRDAAAAAGVTLHEIQRDPPYGYWAGVRFIAGGAYEAAVSPTSVDGTALAR